MDQLTSLVFFARVTQHGSFSEAARQLGSSPASVSRAVQQLEARLGSRLLNRTTRSLSLTEDGKVFYEYCQQILNQLEEAELALSRARSAPTGTLRLDLSVALGRLHIAPALPQLAERYPDLKFEITFNDRYIDLIEAGLDAAVRLGSSPDSQLMMHPLGTARLMVCAAPAYLSRYGEPQTLDDLQSHQCLNFVMPQTGRVRDWIFQQHGRRVEIPVAGRFSFNHPEALVETAIAGGGLIQLYNFLVQPAIARGDLKPVLSAFAPIGSPISILYPQKRYVSAKLKIFIEFMDELTAKLKQQNIIEQSAVH
ncbi:LysR family transcriptional regulator [Oculatella sp. FACHB-28]|uniref:LysR family transcriptional regulator n=1 Tax=Oculatella sp. FACHB-28 TaxID=2692845 RepID=UPI001686FD51|nr:LysR family transcriptional regulator [Oculatella sp. FACHB-28]MBD2060633.1 LysR family transcriptional regulator [Oculatella sp. FACHB-28]